MKHNKLCLLPLSRRMMVVCGSKAEADDYAGVGEQSAMNRRDISQITARPVMLAVLLFAAGLLSGCGGLFGGEGQAQATPTLPPRTIVSTFTLTPVQPATATPEPAA